MKLFLSCDWGTSRFRLRLVDATSRNVIKKFDSDQGIAATYNAWIKSGLPAVERISFYQKVLQDAISKLSPDSFGFVPIVISGMASSSIGMKELPYAKFPLLLGAKQLNVLNIEPAEEFTYPIMLISGCCTESDIMRGEETILLGSYVNDHEEALYILPGTHSKHIMVIDGTAIDFRTYATGELFNVLIEHSILANSVLKGDDEASFLKGFADAQNKNILNNIFSIRARHILNGTSPVENYQYLSGLLIGTELKGLKNSSTIYVVGQDPLRQRYELGLRTIGVRGEIICQSDSAALINGQCKIIYPSAK